MVGRRRQASRCELRAEDPDSAYVAWFWAPLGEILQSATQLETRDDAVVDLCRRGLAFLPETMDLHELSLQMSRAFSWALVPHPSAPQVADSPTNLRHPRCRGGNLLCSLRKSPCKDPKACLARFKSPKSAPAPEFDREGVQTDVLKKKACPRCWLNPLSAIPTTTAQQHNCLGDQ